MAVVTVKSGVITARDASPNTLSNPAIAAGTLRCFAGTTEAANGDSIGSKYILGSVPSNAVMHSLKIFCDAITTCAGDVGLYRTTYDGVSGVGAVVDADFFASAQSLASASVVGIEVAHEATTTYDIDDVEKPLWSALGLSADPNIMYDIVVTLTAAAGSAGTISLKGQYSI